MKAANDSTMTGLLCVGLLDSLIVNNRSSFLAVEDQSWYVARGD